MPRPVVEGLTQAFCESFYLSEDAASIVERICQKRPRAWIEKDLVNLQPALAVPV